MVDVYETVGTPEVHPFGKNSYLEGARQRLKEKGKAPVDFLVLTRGFFNPDGTRQWTRFVTVHDDPADLAFAGLFYLKNARKKMTREAFLAKLAETFPDDFPATPAEPTKVRKPRGRKA